MGVPGPIPRRLWALLAGALALRLLLLPFMHPWDGNTFHNLFAQLANGENPYVSFHELSLEARSRIQVGHAAWYEYFAYPPLLLYLYWPFAQVAALWGPLTTAFYAPSIHTVVPNAWPLSFLLLYKLPIWAADLAIGWMLWSRTQSIALAGLYLLNPLVLVVSGAWMFDAIPAALTLGALLAFERERMAWSGALLALAFLAKYYALFLLPVFFMALVWRRDARAFRLVGAFALVALVLSAPFVPEMLPAFAFNASRAGGGLTLHQLPLSWLKWHDESLLDFEVGVSPMVGSLLLVGGLGVTYLLLDRARPPLARSVLLTLLAFLLFSKLVNEQYALWVLPFALVALAEAPTPLRRAAYHLLWLVPLAYVVVHVPITAFVPGGAPSGATVLANARLLALAAGLAASAFVATLLVSLWAWWPRRGLA